MNFQQTLQFGKMGEGHISRWFQSKGYNALPIYEKEINEGKGPTLFTASGPFIAPDLLIFKSKPETKNTLGNKVFWIEAKTKSAFTRHRITNRWTTGIDLRHYNDYLSIAQFSPWPIWLLFLQLGGKAKDSPDGCPTGLFGRELEYLSKHENHRSDNWGKGGMVYWAHETLLSLATLDEVISAYMPIPTQVYALPEDW